MSPDPNPSSHLSKSASSAQSRTKAQANPAPEPSSPAEPMTDPTPKSVLVPPPTRIVPPEVAPETETPPAAVTKPAAQQALTKPTAARPSEPTQPSQPVESAEVDSAKVVEPETDSTSGSAQLAEPAKSPTETVSTETRSAAPVSKSSGGKTKASATPARPVAEVTPLATPQEVSESTVAAEVVTETGIPETANPEPIAPEPLAPESPEPIASEPVAPEIAGSEVAAETVSETDTASEAAPEAVVVEPPLAAEVASELAPSDPQAIPEAVPETTPAVPQAALLRQQPIPPASEPMQYRAIGLVRGKYMPSEEQFTRGFILTDDEVLIDAVLLGRVMSLVKKHINLEESHLWVVYPRTREKDLELHMQIVGVWEPDKLNRSGTAELDPDLTESTGSDEATDSTEVSSSGADSGDLSAQPVAIEDLDDRYFSVRGEVVYQSDEEDRLLVKIRRAPKPGETEGKAFKVALKGAVQGKALGYFWDMQVQRQNSDLLIMEAVQIGMVPPQKRGPDSRGGRPPRRGAGGPPRRGAGGPPKRRWDNNQGGGRDGGREGGRDGGRDNRPYRSDRPSSERSGERPSTPTPATPRQPISKPVKRQKEEPST